MIFTRKLVSGREEETQKTFSSLCDPCASAGKKKPPVWRLQSFMMKN